MVLRSLGRGWDSYKVIPRNSEKVTGIAMSKKLKPLTDVCHRGILLHEIIHVLQDDQGFFVDYDDRTKKHLREMNALVNHNIYLSQYGKKILYSNGFAAKFKTESKNNLYC